MYSLISRKLKCDLKTAKKIFKSRRKNLLTTTATIQNLGIKKEVFQHTLGNVILPHVNEIKWAKEILIQLSKSGYEIGLLTNIPNQLTLNLLNRANIPIGYFNAIVTGSEIENPKPSLEPFIKIIKKLKIPTEKCAMVGDREEVNLMPARGLGMITILVRNNSNNVDYCINNFYSIIDCINNHNDKLVEGSF